MQQHVQRNKHVLRCVSHAMLVGRVVKGDLDIFLGQVVRFPYCRPPVVCFTSHECGGVYEFDNFHCVNAKGYGGVHLAEGKAGSII